MGDLQIGETFKDRCFITVLATGAPATLLADVTCTIIDELGNRSAGTVAELSDGWYHCTDFTNDAAGTWSTEWSKTADPEDYVFHYPYKEFKVGGGEVTDIKTETAAILANTDVASSTLATAANLAVVDAFHDVPAKDAVTNAQMRDVLGQKTDTPKWFFTDTQSAMALLKGAVHSGGGISYAGTCDAGMGASTTVIVCAQLAGFGDDFFNTDYVLKVALNDNSHGASPEADAARDITDYESATGTFTTAAFNNNVEANDKIVVSKRSFYLTDQIAIQTTPGTNSLAYHLSKYLADGDGDFATGGVLPSNTSLYDVHKVPVADVVTDTHERDVIGRKTDTANVTIGDTSSLMRYLKGAVNQLAAVRARTDRHEITKTFFSASQISVTVTDGGTNLALPSVVLPNITGTITHVYAGFKFRMIENTNAGANKLNVTQYIQTNNAAEGLDNAIQLVDDQFGLAASTREGGDCIVGNIDLQASAHPIDAFNVTVTFQWTTADADLPNIVLNDVQTFLIVSYY
jgi:hypothetical protein